MSCIPTDPDGDCAEIRNTKVRLAALQQRLQTLERLVIDNTKLTETIHKDTSELLETFKTLRGGIRSLRILGEIFKWVTGIIVGAASMYYTFREHHTWPWTH